MRVAAIITGESAIVTRAKAAIRNALLRSAEGRVAVIMWLQGLGFDDPIRNTVLGDNQ